MITLEKAIRDLQARVDGEFCIEGVDNCEDMKLGIEALKREEVYRKGPLGINWALLLGETKEE